MNSYLRLFIITIFLSLLASCATGPQSGQPNSREAESLFARGEYADAAELFSNLAKQVVRSQRPPVLLRAAAAYARAGNAVKSKQILQGLQIDTGKPLDNLLLALTHAHIALSERQADKLIEILNNNPPISGISSFYLADYFDLRADAFNLSGNRIETANELIRRERYLTEQENIYANQQDIWQALSLLTERALLQLRTEPPPNVLSGWMDLVRITKRYQLNPTMLHKAIEEWQQTYPQHPADKRILDSLRSRKQEDISTPDHIALLLPFSGKFATAAEAIRDGFLAAYYSENKDPSQQIRVYDIATDSENNALSVYQQAIKNGAKFIIGPLHKTSIQQIVENGELPVPTLALNYAVAEDIPTNLYQFGLSPEEEARQVAERTWLDGHINAAVLTPSGPWGERVASTFIERWQEIGGQVVRQQDYNAADKDFSRSIRALLNIDSSTQRYRELSRLLNRKLKFTSRRREDIDFIFMAAYPRQARQIRPQLKFYHAADVAVYATSHVFTGNLNPERDRDMDGLIFGDIPWVLSNSTASHRSLRNKVEADISNAGNRLQRLYALGIDSYNIISVLNPLKQYSYERFDGETGSLSLDHKQRIHRQMTWVKFRSGRPVLIKQEI